MIKKVIWWCVTLLFCAALSASAIAYFSKVDVIVQVITHLGYPLYFLQLLGAAKILGVLAVLVPRTPRFLREWAYAGFTFDTISAIWSGLATGDGLGSCIPPLIILILVQTSYWLGKSLSNDWARNGNLAAAPI